LYWAITTPPSEAYWFRAALAVLVGADAEDDGVVGLEGFGGEVGGSEDVRVDAKLVECGGDVVAGAGDVGDVEVRRGMYVDRDDAKGRGGVVVGVGEAWVADGAVAFGVVVAIQGDYSCERGGLSPDLSGVNAHGQVLRLTGFFLVFLWKRGFEQLRLRLRIRRQQNL
jgi:hypothetical protein